MSNAFSSLGNFANSGGFDVLGGLAGLANPPPNVPQPTSNMGSAYYYQPTGQGAADTQIQNQFGQMGQYTQTGYGGNAYNPYSYVQPGLQSYYQGMQNNPYASTMTQSGYQGVNPLAANYQAPSYQQASNQAGNASNQAGYQQFGAGMYDLTGANNGTSQVGGLLSQIGNSQLVGAANQMYAGAQQGGNALQGVGNLSLSNAGDIQNITQQTLGGLGSLANQYASGLNQFAGQGAGNLQQLAQQTTQGLMPYAQQSANQLPQLAQQYAQPGFNGAPTQRLPV